MSGYTHTGRDVAESETVSLIAASKVSGTKVYNRAGESLGSIYDVMVNKRTGQVTYAVLSFGGFLGIGEKYYPLPWNRLTYNASHGGYVVAIDKEALEGAPAYGVSENPDWSTPAYGDSIDEYWENSVL